MLKLPLSMCVQVRLGIFMMAAFAKTLYWSPIQAQALSPNPSSYSSADAIHTSTADSLGQLYLRYQQVLAQAENVARLEDQVSTLSTQQTQFRDLLESNTERVQKLTDKDLYSVKLQWEARRGRLVHSAEFAQTATVSLNAIRQFDATINYLNSIAALNNPDNGELGFTLVEQMNRILEQEIVHGRSKVNGIAVEKIRAITTALLQSPITETVASAVPAVSSMRAMLGLVANIALTGKDVEVADLAKFQKAMQVYVDHYNGLAAAGADFHQSLVNLNVRKEGLETILRQLIEERIAAGGATVDPKSLAGLTITELVNQHYNRALIEAQVVSHESKSKGDYFNMLVDARLGYPDYAVNQAKFVRDETLSLGREYVSIFRTYQRSIRSTLETSRPLGKQKLIDAKLAALDRQLEQAIAAFDESVNAPRLDASFKALAGK